MIFKLSKKETNGVVVLTLSGRLTSPEPDDVINPLLVLRNAIGEEKARGNRKILLNLKDATYISSAGLGQLITAIGTITQMVCSSCGVPVSRDKNENFEKCANCGSSEQKNWGQVRLSNLRLQPEDLINFTKLNTVLDIHPDEEDALVKFT